MRTILVIDDEPVVIHVAEASLRQEGYEIVSATSPEEAVKTAASLAGRIALVIVNHSVSMMPGRNLIEEIEELQPSVKVLRFSGHSEDHLRATGQIRPGSFFLQKPFTAQTLRKKVRDIIGPEPESV